MRGGTPREKIWSVMLKSSDSSATWRDHPASCFICFFSLGRERKMLLFYAVQERDSSGASSAV